MGPSSSSCSSTPRRRSTRGDRRGRCDMTRPCNRREWMGRIALGTGAALAGLGGGERTCRAGSAEVDDERLSRETWDFILRCRRADGGYAPSPDPQYAGESDTRLSDLAAVDLRGGPGPDPGPGAAAAGTLGRVRPPAPAARRPVRQPGRRAGPRGRPGRPLQHDPGRRRPAGWASGPRSTRRRSSSGCWPGTTSRSSPGTRPASSRCSTRHWASRSPRSPAAS